LNAGEPQAFSIQATPNKTIAEKLNVGIVDAQGAISTDISVVENPYPLNYVATLHTSPTLAAGTYTGSFEVRLCMDSPTVCAQPYGGSPWHVPYKFVVNSGTDLRPLSAWPQVPAWSSSFQGNASHTGMVSASLDANAFSRRWGWTDTSATPSTPVSPVAVDSGVVFAVTGLANKAWTLWAISESSGAVLWKHALGSWEDASPPAAANGRVYVATTDFAKGTLWVFDEQTGALVVQQPLAGDYVLAPTPYGNEAFAESWMFPNWLTKFDGLTNSISWNSQMPYEGTDTPAVDGTYAYTFDRSGLHAVRKSDGVIDFTVPVPPYMDAGTSFGVVLGTNSAFLKWSSQYNLALIGLDLTNRSMKWEQLGGFRSDPVLSGNVIYDVNGSLLEARNADTGAVLWTWTFPEGGGGYPPPPAHVVATNNIVFVDTGMNVYAIDTASHAPLWHYAASGSLAISANGVLYISTNSSLVAINLK
jgi:hypothetical protein